MSKFMAASRHATELDKMRILLETRIQEVNADLFKVCPYSILVLVYLTIYLCLIIPFSFLFIVHVKVYGGVQTCNGTGQDEDSVGDKDSRSEC